jgi:hypothetical protein
MEREADRIGASVMASAGFDPVGMASMFERLQKASRLNDSGNFPYLRSHPLTTQRIGEARARVEAGGDSVLPAVAPVTGSMATPLEHTAAMARARVLMDVRVDVLQRWQRLDAESSAVQATRADQFADAYSAALASSLLRDWSRADASIKKALDILGFGQDAFVEIDSDACQQIDVDQLDAGQPLLSDEQHDPARVGGAVRHVELHRNGSPGWGPGRAAPAA